LPSLALGSTVWPARVPARYGEKSTSQADISVHPARLVGAKRWSIRVCWVAPPLPIEELLKDDIMKTTLLPDVTFGDNPFAFLRRLTPTMERLFDELPMPVLRNVKAAGEGWLPNIDVFVREGTFVLRADLPGMTKDNVKVEVKDEFIAIEGERKSDFEEDKDGVYRAERVYGTFFRAVPMPEGVKPEDVKATFKNGVLEVTAPLPLAKKAPKARTVEVEEPVAAKAKPAA
jgi:HSP20 family protein